MRLLLLLLLALIRLFWHCKQGTVASWGAVHIVSSGLCVPVLGPTGVAEGAAAQAVHVVAALTALHHVATAARRAALPQLAACDVVHCCIFC